MVLVIPVNIPKLKKRIPVGKGLPKFLEYSLRIVHDFICSPVIYSGTINLKVQQ